MWAARNAGVIGKWLGLRRARGAAVPFAAPALRLARVCDDERDGLIAVLRDFANNGAAYIVPWTSLPLVVALTEHDAAIHAAVNETRASTPEQVRSVVQELALSGALGAEARSRELERSQQDRATLEDMELVLVLHLLDSCGADLAKLASDPARWRDVHATSAVSVASTMLGVARRDVYRRLAELMKLLTPIGLVSDDSRMHPGWLRVLQGEIASFATTLAAQPVVPDAGAHLSRIAQAAERTARLSGTVLNILDYAVLDITGTLRRWDAEQPVLRQAIDRLSQTLDEWPAIMKAVRDALRCPTDAMIAQLRSVRAVLREQAEAGLPDGAGNAAHGSATRLLATRLSAIMSLISGRQCGLVQDG
jgi:hypothetical protein